MGHCPPFTKKLEPTTVLKLKPGVTLADQRESTVVGFFPRDFGIFDVNGNVNCIPRQPDPYSLDNVLAAVQCRVCTEMPDGRADVMRRFEEFAKAFIMDNYHSLNPSQLPSFTDWLGGSKYNTKIRSEFRTLREGLQYCSRKLGVVKCFLKREVYDVYKPARAICSPSDLSKTILGPIFHAVDHVLFSSRYFIKGSDPKFWPRRLLQMFSTFPVFESDHTSMEAVHKKTFAKIFRFFVQHVLRGSGIGNCERRLIDKLIMGVHDMRFKDVSVQCEQRLMSGSVWTSSQNGLINLLVLLYLYTETRYGALPPRDLARLARDAPVLVEGDDGLVSALPGLDEPNRLASLGVKLNMIPHHNFGDAKFCGITCDLSTLQVIKDPKKVLRNFFYLDAKYLKWRHAKLMGLLRAKALSYKYLFGNAPIIGPMMDWVLYETRNYTSCMQSEIDNSWIYNFVKEAVANQGFDFRVKAHVDDAARQLVEEKYGISIFDQLRIEASFKGPRAIVDMSDIYRNDLAHNIMFAGSVKRSMRYDVDVIGALGKPGRLQNVHDRRYSRCRSVFTPP